MKRDNDAILTNVLIAGATLTGILFVGDFILAVPESEKTAPITVTDRSEILRNYFIIIGGILALLVAVWRGWTADKQRRIGDAQIEQSRQQLDQTTAGIRWDRFHRALDYLNDKENQTARMVGIRTISRVVHENTSEFYEQGIAALSDFCRESSQIEHRQFVDNQRFEAIERTPDDRFLAVETISNLQRLGKSAGVHAVNNRPDLSGIVLCQRHFQSADFDRVNLNNAVMRDTSFTYCSLEKTSWFGANTANVSLIRCNITEMQGDPRGNLTNKRCFVFSRENFAFQPFGTNAFNEIIVEDVANREEFLIMNEIGLPIPFTSEVTFKPFESNRTD